MKGQSEMGGEEKAPPIPLKKKLVSRVHLTHTNRRSRSASFLYGQSLDRQWSTGASPVNITQQYFSSSHTPAVFSVC